METFCVLPSAHVCTELIVETNQLRNYMTKSKLKEISEIEKADVVLVATCAFNQEFEDESFSNIENTLKNRKENAKVIVSGCYPKIAPKTYKKFKETNTVLPLNMKKIEEIIPSEITLKESISNTVNMHEYMNSETFMMGVKLKKFFRKSNKLFPLIPEPKWLDSLPMTDWYFIQGGNGCKGECTFCAIKHSRGGIQSTPIDQIIPQIENAVRRGYKTISFAATDMGCWGNDFGLTLPDLLKEVVKVKGDFFVDMHYVEPEWLIEYMPGLEPVFNSGKIRSFGTPVQSGSNKILKSMGRAYTIEEYIQIVNFVIDKTKVRSLNSIIMTGFPGETVDDYLQSYYLLDKTKISYFCLLKYEGRYNVKSETFSNKVPEHIKDNRVERLQARAILKNYLKLPNFIVERKLKRKFGEFI